MNIKLAEASAIDLAKRAAAAGLTQKQWVARALAASGIKIDLLDLEDRTPAPAGGSLMANSRIPIAAAVTGCGMGEDADWLERNLAGIRGVEPEATY